MADTFLDAVGRIRGTRAVSSSEAHTRRVRDWLMARPAAAFEELRVHAPTLVVGRLAFVSRHADVRDVLARTDVFGVEPYRTAIRRVNRGDDFLLGLDDGPEYRQQVAWLREAVPPQAAAQALAAARAACAEVLATVGDSRRLDLADAYGRHVAARAATLLFGIDDVDPGTLARWARDIFTEGFVNVFGLPLLTNRALRASAAFRAALDARIAQAHAAAATGRRRDDALGRLLARQQADRQGPSDARIRDLLLWSVAGMVDNVATAVCRAVDVLLDQPAALAEARQAARADDMAALWAQITEALRFGTPTPMVVRRSVVPSVLRAGSGSETAIPAGTLVFVGVGAAMLDPAVVEAPAEFRAGRPDDHYLHFGAGLHACLGAHVARALVCTAVGQVLTRPGLRRARGVTGRLRLVGVFPKRFVVEIEE